MDDQETYPFLHIPCFVSHLSDCWESVLHLGERLTCRRRQLFSPHDDDSFFYIHSGLTCCYVREHAGQKDDIRLFMGEKCFIRETLVSAGLGSWNTVHRCLTDVVMYRFPRVLLSDPGFIRDHGELVDNFVFSVAAKSVSVQIFSSLLKKSNEQKIATYVYGFHLYSGRRHAFAPPLSQVQLAELLGINILTVNRIIVRWKRRGILECYTRRNLRILNLEELVRIRNGVDAGS